MSDGPDTDATVDATSVETSSDQARGMPAIGELDYIGVVVRRALLIAVFVIIISVVAPGLIDRLLEVLSDADRLHNIRPGWFLLMVVAEALSFICLWWLMRTLLPQISLFVAATSQLTSNSVSRVIPGGAAIGGATMYRMLAVAGINTTQAGGVLAAMSILSTAALFAIPAIGAAIAVFGAPIPEGILPVAIASAALFLLSLVVGIVAIRTTRPLVFVARQLGHVAHLAGRVFRRSWSIDPDNVVAERDRLVGVLGTRWLSATAASGLNWMFDYLVLVAALYAVDADPRLSLVMVAYASGAVLAMIPITPGGFGFVEVGLFGVLVLSGISAQDATVATLAYRVVSFWLPIASGLVAWMLFRRRFPRRTAPQRL